MLKECFFKALILSIDTLESEIVEERHFSTFDEASDFIESKESENEDFTGFVVEIRL